MLARGFGKTVLAQFGFFIRFFHNIVKVEPCLDHLNLCNVAIVSKN